MRDILMPNQFTNNELKVVAEAGEAQKAFLARGLASLAAAKKSGEYFSSAHVLRELDERLANAKKREQK
jgi:hypothetical protein